MPRPKQNRRSISFRPATYDAAARLAERRKESLAGLVDRLICAELEREGMTAPPEYIRPSRVAPVDMPAQHMEF